MASTLEFVEFVCGQLSDLGEVTYRKLFGEYGIYLNGKYLAIISKDQLFVKPTIAGRTVLGTPNEQPPYEGAPIIYFLIEDIDNAEQLKHLFTATWEELPFPKPKKPKNTKKE